MTVTNCQGCHYLQECEDAGRCLHPVASSTNALVEAAKEHRRNYRAETFEKLCDALDDYEAAHAAAPSPEDYVRAGIDAAAACCNERAKTVGDHRAANEAYCCVKDIRALSPAEIAKGVSRG